MAGTPINIPNDLYYISKVQFIQDILNEGLLPYKIEKREENSKNIDDKISQGKSISICLSWDQILALDPLFSLKEYAIFKINFKWLKNKLIEDDSFDEQYLEAMVNKEIEEEEYTQFSWKYDGFIDKNRITYLGNAVRNKHDKDLWNLMEVNKK